MKALKYNPEEIEVVITDISLLTVEEAQALPEDIGRYGQRWWLRSHGREHYDAAFVFKSGAIYKIGDYIGYPNYAVRPAVTISDAMFAVGDTVIIQNKKYVAIAPDRLLYNDKFVYHRFDELTNDYEKSEIKKMVDEWLD